jgi:hypothetical protein
VTPLPKSNLGSAIGGAFIFLFVIFAQWLNAQLIAGKIPIAPEFQGLVPGLSAMLTAGLAMMTPYIQKVRNDPTNGKQQ